MFFNEIMETSRKKSLQKELFTISLPTADIQGYKWKNSKKEVLLVLPGGFCSYNMGFVDLLAKEYEVWCPHPRGMGRGIARSFAKDGDYSIDTQFKDMSSLVPAIAEQAGKKLHVIGYSAGAWYARSFASGVYWDDEKETFAQSQAICKERAEKYIKSLSIVSSPKKLPQIPPYPLSLFVLATKTLGPYSLKYPTLWPNEEEYKGIKGKIRQKIWKGIDTVVAEVIPYIDFEKTLFGKYGKNLTAEDIKDMRELLCPAERAYAEDCVRLFHSGTIESIDGFDLCPKFSPSFPILIVAGSQDLITDQMLEAYKEDFRDHAQLWTRFLQGAGHFSLIQNFGTGKDLALLIDRFIKNP